MSDVSSEVQAARRAAGLLERYPRALLAVRGADRSRFLHNLVSHDIKGLQPGQGRPACLLDCHGKIRAAFVVHARPDELILEMDPCHQSAARRLLAQYLITEAVELQEATDRYRILPLVGPRSAEILLKSWPGARLPEAHLNHREGPAGSPLRWIVRWDLLGIPGIHLWVDAKAKAQVRGQLMAQGQPMGLRALSQEAFDLIRIEAGIPWPGREIDGSVIFNELGQEDWVSYTKGCFVGQEIVARIKYRAHPPRLLTGFLIQGDQIPPAGSPIELDLNPVGLITSACLSPTLNRGIALGFLKFGLLATEFQVKTPKGSMQATVTALPFAGVRPCRA